MRPNFEVQLPRAIVQYWYPVRQPVSNATGRVCIAGSRIAFDHAQKTERLDASMAVTVFWFATQY